MGQAQISLKKQAVIKPRGDGPLSKELVPEVDLNTTNQVKRPMTKLIYGGGLLSRGGFYGLGPSKIRERNIKERFPSNTIHNGPVLWAQPTGINASLNIEGLNDGIKPRGEAKNALDGGQRLQR